MGLHRTAVEVLTQSTPFQALIKPVLKRALWPEGSVRTILRGPTRGLRYRIFHGYGWSPIYGGWEPRTQQLMVKHVAANSVVYDVGANYGIHTLLMARLTQRGGGSVHAFEPMPAIMAELRSNVALNGFRHVTFAPEALSDTAGSISFIVGRHAGAGRIASAGEQAGEQISVPTLTLDEYVYERGNPAPTFVKMDVEGAESRVLAGATRVLTSARPTLLLDLHGVEQHIAVGTALHALGYELYRVDDGRIVRDVTRGEDSPDGVPDEVLALPKSL